MDCEWIRMDSIGEKYKQETEIYWDLFGAVSCTEQI